MVVLARVLPMFKAGFQKMTCLSLSIGKKGGRTIKKQDLIKIGEHYVVNSEENYLFKQNYTSKTAWEVRIFERPVFAFGAADDEYFKKFKDPAVIGEHYLMPREWLPGANTIVSYFLPFSQEIRKGNSIDPYWPSEEWLDGFAQGQAFLNKLGAHLQLELKRAGYDSLVPSLDKRFWARTGFNNDSPGAEVLYTSNWSERHAAFVCGLGTFGLSKALITRKGLAGRFGSVITELDLAADKRHYVNINEYCSMCGKCARNCPANAISIEEGKNHQICSEFLGKTLEKYRPRYGCGKCQINVPCESGIPEQNKVK